MEELNGIMQKYCSYITENMNVQYKVDFEKLPAVHALHKWVGAQCASDCLYGIPNDMNMILKFSSKGSSYLGEVGNELFKWTGGCIWDNCLYAFSRTNSNLLKMSLNTKKIEYIHLQEKYRKEHHYGGVCTKSGIIYQPPRDSDHILVWNLREQNSKKICLISEKKFRYCGSVLHPNGFAYFLPEAGERVIKLDTKTEEWNFIGEPIDAMVFDAKLAEDGCIYGYSAYSLGILKIDVRQDFVEMIHEEIYPGAYGTKLGINGHLYSIPGEGKFIWDYDPLTDTLKSIYQFEDSKYKAKFAGGASMENGDIYGVPAQENNLLCLKVCGNHSTIPEDIYLDIFSDFY